MLLLQNGEHVFLGRSLAQSSTFQICCAKTGKCVFSSALLPQCSLKCVVVRGFQQATS